MTDGAGWRGAGARVRWQALGVVGATGVGAAALLAVGPLPISNATYAVPHRAPFLYMISAFPFFGVLLGELAYRWGWRLRPSREALILAAQVALLGVLAVARLAVQVPASGHVMLQVAFVALVPGLAGARGARRALWAAGWLVLVAQLWTKLVLWGDWVTPSLGAAAGLAIWAFGLVASPSTGADSRASHSRLCG